MCSKGSIQCLMPWLWVIQVQFGYTEPLLWCRVTRMGSLSSPCWGELLFHGCWCVCSARQGTALKLLGSVVPVVNYWASSGWKLPWRNSSRSMWCVWPVWGWEHVCVSSGWKRRGNPLVLPSSLHFYLGWLETLLDLLSEMWGRGEARKMKLT